MRVLHVIPAVALRYGGPSSAIVPMCVSVSALGVDARILTTDADGTAHLDVTRGEWTSWHGVRTMFFRNQFSEAYKFSGPLARWARLHVGAFDVVHIHGVLSHAPLTVAAACRRAGVPYIVRPLGTVAQWSLSRKAWRKRLLMTLGARVMLERAAAIHCTTDDEKRDAERTLGLTRCVVIPLGIDPALFAETATEAAERARDPYVLFLSRLHPKKNLETLIESFADLCRNGLVSWRLIVAGNGDADYERALQRLAREQNVDNRIRFVGWVDGDEKRAILRRASLFTLPSFHENFGVSALEALAAGVPALVSRHVQLADAVAEAHAGWVVDTSRESVRAGLLEALQNADERMKRGHAARALARRFAWPDVASELVRLYERIQHQEPRPATRLADAVTA